MSNSQAIIPSQYRYVAEGSINDVAAKTGRSPQAVLQLCDKTLSFDASGSMNIEDAGESRKGKRFDVAVAEGRKLQSAYPGSWMVVQFSSEAEVKWTGIPEFDGGGTDLAAALEILVQFEDSIGEDAAKALTHFILTDGTVDNDERALELARKLKGKINAIYIGGKDEWYESAMEFLRKLVKRSGGTAGEGIRPGMLADPINKILALNPGKPGGSSKTGSAKTINL